MSNSVPTEKHLRSTLIFLFHLKKSAAESHRMLAEVYGEHALSEATCKLWFERFKANDFDITGKEGPGQPKKFDDEELKTLLDKNSCRTLKELAEALNADESTVKKHLKAMGMVQKDGNWMPQ